MQIPSKLLPNFDRVSLKNIFFSMFFLGDTLAKKSTVRKKPGIMSSREQEMKGSTCFSFVK